MKPRKIVAQRNIFEIDKNNGTFAVFKIYPDEAASPSSSNLPGWIWLSGGIVLSPGENDEFAIPLIDYHWYVEENNSAIPDEATLPKDHFNSSFIYDAYIRGSFKDLDLNNYRVGESAFMKYDANQILRRIFSWDQLVKAAPNSRATLPARGKQQQPETKAAPKKTKTLTSNASPVPVSVPDLTRNKSPEPQQRPSECSTPKGRTNLKRCRPSILNSPASTDKRVKILTFSPNPVSVRMIDKPKPVRASIVSGPGPTTVPNRSTAATEVDAEVATRSTSIASRTRQRSTSSPSPSTNQQTAKKASPPCNPVTESKSNPKSGPTPKVVEEKNRSSSTTSDTDSQDDTPPAERFPELLNRNRASRRISTETEAVNRGAKGPLRLNPPERNRSSGNRNLSRADSNVQGNTFSVLSSISVPDSNPVASTSKSTLPSNSSHVTEKQKQDETAHFLRRLQLSRRHGSKKLSQSQESERKSKTVSTTRSGSVRETERDEVLEEFSSSSESASASTSAATARSNTNLSRVPTRRQRHGRKEYTIDEGQKILDYICRHDQHPYTKGNLIWEEMERNKLTDHTAASMKEHFRKKVYPRRKQVYSCSTEDMEKFRMAKAAVAKGQRVPVYLPQESFRDFPKKFRSPGSSSIANASSRNFRFR